MIGIDEVGRGCWAGPLVAAAVELSDDVFIDGLTDSKKLTAAHRLALLGEIRSKAKQIGLGWVWPSEINEIGLTESVRSAMQRAVDEIDPSNIEVIIDGNINFLPNITGSKAIIKADGSILSVSAASVVAKVARDEYMSRIAKKYPNYGFESHVGYGTSRHIAALREHGVTAIHRMNYKPIKRLMMEGQ